MASAAASWLELAQGVDALEGAALDAGLVRRFQSSGTPLPPLTCHLPGFKRYSSSELPSCGGSAWPAVSITGGVCALNCDHCRAEILKPMLPAVTPEALWRTASRLIEQGAGGMLLTGGSTRRNEVEYAPFLDTLRRIKDGAPHFRIAAHTGLLDRNGAQGLADAGVDIAMLDVIGAQDTVAQVYHLKRPVEDFEASLAHLVATGMRVVPHIVIGLHYGRLLGEWRALEMIAPYSPAAVVLVVVMPFYASSSRPFKAPSSAEVGHFFLNARQALPGIPLQLGCARPAGRAKAEIDIYGVMAGLDGIAHPTEGTVELARKIGRELRVSGACCSLGAGEPLECPPGRPFPMKVVAHG